MSTTTCTPATKKPRPCYQHFINDTCMAYYDGGLGYEAYVCRHCGTYFDHEGEHPVDEWSEGYITKQQQQPTKH